MSILRYALFIALLMMPVFAGEHAPDARELAQRLCSADFDIREQASKWLGAHALQYPALVEQLLKHDDLEVRSLARRAYRLAARANIEKELTHVRETSAAVNQRIAELENALGGLREERIQKKAAVDKTFTAHKDAPDPERKLALKKADAELAAVEQSCSVIEKELEVLQQRWNNEGEESHLRALQLEHVLARDDLRLHVPPWPAEFRAKLRKRITVDWSDKPLQDVGRELQTLTGIVVKIPDELPQRSAVLTLRITDMPAYLAFHWVCRILEIGYEFDGEQSRALLVAEPVEP